MLVPDSFGEDEEDSPSILPESISITRIDDLLSQMRFREVPKRSQFNIPFEIGNDFVIGVKGCASSLLTKTSDQTRLVDTGWLLNRKRELISISPTWEIEWKSLLSARPMWTRFGSCSLFRECVSDRYLFLRMLVKRKRKSLKSCMACL